MAVSSHARMANFHILLFASSSPEGKRPAEEQDLGKKLGD
jgi:hypothetical protein